MKFRYDQFEARPVSLLPSRVFLSSLRILLLMLVVMVSIPALHGQTIDDGIMLRKKAFCTGLLYTNDHWAKYWEGALERTNGNLGTVSTQTIMWAGNYGVTDKLDILASVPHVHTHASEGVLKGQSGLQDLTIAAKYKALSIPIKEFGALRAIAVVSGSIPISDYTPDFLPLSIGLHSKTISGRATLNFLGRQGIYLLGSTAYTYRGNVKLDRSSYYTNGHLYLSNEVAMPNQFSYNVAAGYRKNNTTLVGTFAQQQTRGGGDIRRQDIPFVSNRMNYSKAGVSIAYPVPRVRELQYWFGYQNTFDGRNVGHANTFTTGLMYTLHFNKGGDTL